MSHIEDVGRKDDRSVPVVSSRPLVRRRRSALALAAGAAGALAIGAFAIGALAIGRLAIGRLAVGRLRLRSAEIDELVVGRLTVIAGETAKRR